MFDATSNSSTENNQCRYTDQRQEQYRESLCIGEFRYKIFRGVQSLCVLHVGSVSEGRIELFRLFQRDQANASTMEFVGVTVQFDDVDAWFVTRDRDGMRVHQWRDLSNKGHRSQQMVRLQYSLALSWEILTSKSHRHSSKPSPKVCTSSELTEKPYFSSKSYSPWIPFLSPLTNGRPHVCAGN